MDINEMRVLITVLTFIAFVVIVAWAWSSSRRHEFDVAARMALDDDELTVRINQGSCHGLQ
jgi:cytochrome c oxidase cbb3-type subunit IV